MTQSLTYRVETRVLDSNSGTSQRRIWRRCNDAVHAEMVATQLRQSPTVSAVRIVAVTD